MVRPAPFPILQQAAYAFQVTDKIRLRHKFSIYAETFPHGDKVGRGKHSHPIAAFLQDRRQISTNGTFSVCACNMNDRLLFARFPQPPQKCSRIFRRILSGKSRNLQKIRFCLSIVHICHSSSMIPWNGSETISPETQRYVAYCISPVTCLLKFIMLRRTPLYV